MNESTLDKNTECGTMIIEYYHASKYGNGVRVAEEFSRFMAAKGVTVNIHHVKKAKPKEIPPADLYVFSSPGRFGKPIGDIRGFLGKAQFNPGTRCAVVTTEMAPQPDKKTGKVSTEEGDCQKVLPIMREILQAKGLNKVAEQRVYVLGIKGPLEEGWQKKVDAFAESIPLVAM
ncbi:MAG: flavodoxin family protein [Candidatus Thorarchaeota archaeon]